MTEGIKALALSSTYCAYQGSSRRGGSNKNGYREDLLYRRCPNNLVEDQQNKAELGLEKT